MLVVLEAISREIKRKKCRCQLLPELHYLQTHGVCGCCNDQQKQRSVIPVLPGCNSNPAG